MFLIELNLQIYEETRREFTQEQLAAGASREDIDDTVSTFAKNRSTIRYNKNKELPREPKQRADIVIDGLYAKTIAGDYYVLYDIGIELLGLNDNADDFLHYVKITWTNRNSIFPRELVS